MKKWYLLVVFCLMLPVYAAEDIYPFATPQQAQRFTTLTTQLRCLVCQNQNLAQSNSGLAADLRKQIYQQIIHGQSDPDILRYLTERYGNYILYRPPIDALTVGLWFGPFILLVSGLGYLFYYLTRVKRND